MTNSTRRFRGKSKKPGRNGLPLEVWQSVQPRPGESKEDWRRRYNRERQAYRRSYTKEKEAVRRRELYWLNRDEIVAKKREYRRLNPEQLKASQKRYFDKHRDKRIASLKAWAAKNPERMAQVKKDWYAANPHMNAAYASRRRAAETMATPAWADWDAIQRIYRLAAETTERTGIEHHVDHEVPLRGKTVCGLHVETNLRVVPAEVNLRKRNKFEDGAHGTDPLSSHVIPALRPAGIPQAYSPG